MNHPESRYTEEQIREGLLSDGAKVALYDANLRYQNVDPREQSEDGWTEALLTAVADHFFSQQPLGGDADDGDRLRQSGTSRSHVAEGGPSQGAGSALTRTYELSVRLLSIPNVSGGLPIFSNGVRIDVPLDRIRAGESIEHVAKDFELHEDEVALVAAVAGLHTQHPSDGQEGGVEE
jgi:uncharacterized protein (DUF433 family)